jgi:hypothetical protein
MRPVRLSHSPLGRCIIYRPAVVATQSGRANGERWLLEFVNDQQRYINPITGWQASGDTTKQLRLEFNSQAEAERYAERSGIEYSIKAPDVTRAMPKKAYRDNFLPKRSPNG